MRSAATRTTERFHANLERAGVDQRVRHVRLLSEDALGEVRGPGRPPVRRRRPPLRAGPGRHRALGRAACRRAATLLVHDSYNAIGVTLAQLRLLFLSPRVALRRAHPLARRVAARAAVRPRAGPQRVASGRGPSVLRPQRPDQGRAGGPAASPGPACWANPTPTPGLTRTTSGVTWARTAVSWARSVLLGDRPAPPAGRGGGGATVSAAAGSASAVRAVVSRDPRVRPPRRRGSDIGVVAHSGRRRSTAR